jgi:hypothetical protein
VLDKILVSVALVLRWLLARVVENKAGVCVVAALFMECWYVGIYVDG